MFVIIHILLMLSVGRCADDVFETKSIHVGQTVKLMCPRNKSLTQTHLFWIRLVSGGFPDFLGGTFSFDYDGGNNTPRTTVKQEKGTFILNIYETELRDAGVYYCIEVKRLDMRLLKGVFLAIEGFDSDVIIEEHVSNPNHPGDSVTFQCSVLSDFENKMCPVGHSVYWFRSGSDKSYPSIIYAEGTSGDKCEKSPETRSQSCVYSFSKNVSSSDAGTYHCAVASCGHILFGNGTKLDVKSLQALDLQTVTVLVLLSTTLAISLIVIVFLIYAIKKKPCGSCDASVKTDAATPGDQRGEDSLAYSALTFRRSAGKPERNNVETTSEAVYTHVKTVVIRNPNDGLASTGQSTL